MFGKVNILSLVDAGYRRSIIKHNELVDRNRNSLNRIINCIKFCGFHELPLKGHDEVEGSANRGVFLDLVTCTADLDGAFRDHFEKYNMVKITSKSIQNDIVRYVKDFEPVERFFK